MADNNLRHWDVLGKTDPSQTKPFTRAGGFKGTAIKPIWIEKRLTETFGPCGVGWGICKPEFTLVPTEDEILVFCTVQCWYKEPGTDSADLWGVGGDKVAAKRQSGVSTDDEAFKKAYTDAVGNAFKHLGVAADVHMGMFDDSKYVNERKLEEKKATAGAPEKPNGEAKPEVPKTAHQKSDHPRRAEALDAYKRLNHALGLTRTTKEAADLYRIHADNLALIGEVSGETYLGLKKRFAEFGINVDAERARIASEERMMGADEAEHALQ